MTFRPARKTFVVAALVGGMLAGSVALAAWLASGTGTGSAKAVNAENLVVTDGTASADLYPGMANGDLFLTVQNTNDYPVRITSIQAAAGDVTSTAGASCEGATTGVSLDGGQITLPAPQDVGANSSISFTVADVVNMTNASDTSCQGATFSIPVTVTGASNA
jgi:hypothetical protein